MKTQLLAVPLLVALMLSPAIAAAATGTLTFTSPTSGSSLSGTQSYTIAGTISPVPPFGSDNVNIQVSNPASQLVDVQTVSVSNTGTFSYSTNAGGSAAWTSGTYKILATDSNGATNTITFTYKASGTTPAGGVTLELQVNAPSLVYAGQAVQVFALAFWSNGTLAANANFTGSHYHAPSGSATALPAPTSVGPGMYEWTWTLASGAADGLYSVHATASKGGQTTWASAGFTVNSQVASTSALAPITSSLASLTSAVSGITSSLSSLTSTVNGISSSVASLTTTVGTINTNVQGLGSQLTTLSNTVSGISSSISSITSSITTLTNDVSAMQTTVSGLSGLGNTMSSLQSSVNSLSSSVSSAQTYILVVAALAVITLVLELAILIRKMS